MLLGGGGSDLPPPPISIAMPIIPPEASDGMESLYSEETPQPMKPEMGEETPPEETMEESPGSTAMIDNKVLSPEGKPLKAGDRVILEVVKNYGDESEVRYGTMESMGGADQMSEANAELDQMGMEA